MSQTGIGQLAPISKTKDAQCPRCFVILDGAVSSDPRVPRPRPGDFTICLSCGARLEFTGTLDLQYVRDETLIELAGDEKFKIVNELGNDFVCNSKKAKKKR